MMEHLPENNAEQGNLSAAIPLTSLGRMLREAREHLGLSVADVAAQIKFAPRQIEALEADDFKHLPEAAFLRGFVRSYAKDVYKRQAYPLWRPSLRCNCGLAQELPSQTFRHPCKDA